jgi:hypothetical protein
LSTPDPNAVKNFGSALLLAVFLWSCGGQKELDEATPVLIGTVYVIGNEPFTELSIQTEDRSIRIVQKDTTELYRRLWKMQGQKLRIHFRPANTASDSTHIILEHFELVKD